jgi:hypothetical protein
LLKYLLVGPTATRITSSKSTLFIHHPLPWKTRITEVSNTTDDPCGTGIPAQSSQLAIGHNSAARYLGNNRFHPVSKVRWRIHYLIIVMFY